MNSLDTDNDSEDSEDSMDDENEDIIEHLQYVQLQRDLRKQGLITENAE